MFKRIALIILGILLIRVQLSAKIWEVDTTGSEGDSVQFYVDTAYNSSLYYNRIDTVMLANGTYHMFINDTVGLIMRDSVVLLGQGGASACTLTALSSNGADAAWHVIYCDSLSPSDCKAIIKGLTIKDGNANSSEPHNSGGGIFLRRSSPAVDSCMISDNSADVSGGGLYLFYNSSPTLTNNTVAYNNSANAGGGLFINFLSEPILNNNTIAYNSSRNYGGGLIISYFSSPTLENNTIEHNSTGLDGGGIYMYYDCSPTLENNTIKNNAANTGGGLYLDHTCSPILTYNTIEKNSAITEAGGLYIFYHSSPTLTNNMIINNSADYGGGFYVTSNSSAGLSNNTIANNSANYGGGGYVVGNSSIELTKCVLATNISDTGGAIYDALNSKVIMDSCFATDNGSTSDNKSGFAYLAEDADSGVTFSIAHSNLYYSTLQPDSEIANKTSVTIPLENNFWWYTDSTTIQNLIEGQADISPFATGFITGVPGEPVSVDSVRNYEDSTYTNLCNTLQQPGTLYLRVYGQDRLTNIREAAVVIIKTNVNSEGIGVALAETDTNSGIYEGKAYVLETTGNDTVRTDDIYQRVKVDADDDTIDVFSNIDAAESYRILYNPSSYVEELPQLPEAIEIDIPDVLTDNIIIKYHTDILTQITIKLYDVTGRCVRNLVDKEYEPGYYQVALDTKKLSEGVYFYSVKAGEYHSRKKVVILR